MFTHKKGNKFGVILETSPDEYYFCCFLTLGFRTDDFMTYSCSQENPTLDYYYLLLLLSHKM